MEQGQEDELRDPREDEPGKAGAPQTQISQTQDEQVTPGAHPHAGAPQLDCMHPTNAPMHAT